MSAAPDPELTGFLHASMPFTASFGAEALAAGPDEVRTRVAWDPSPCTAGGVLHGGVLMALADATAAWCAFLRVPEGGSTTTVESNTNFLRAVRAGHLTATSRPLHAGPSSWWTPSCTTPTAGSSPARRRPRPSCRPPDRATGARASGPDGVVKLA